MTHIKQNVIFVWILILKFKCILTYDGWHTFFNGKLHKLSGNILVFETANAD